MFYLRFIFLSFILNLFTIVFAQPPLPHMDESPIQEHQIPGPMLDEPYDHVMASPSIIDYAVEDFMVNEQEGNAQKLATNVAMNHNGVSFVVWYDWRNGNQMCFGQIIDSSGMVLGPEFQINSQDRSRSYSSPDVAANAEGNFLVVWQDGRNWTNIFGQMYTEDGTKIGEELSLIDDLKRAQQYAPRIAYNNDRFVVVWYDTRNGYTYDIYGQILDGNGAKIDTNFVVNDDIQGSRKYLPSVAMDNDGDFLVAWYSTQATYYNIYAREFNSAGSPKDSVYQLSENSPNTSHYSPDVALSDTGYIVVWYGYPTGRNRIWGQFYAQDQGPVGKNIEISDNGGQFYSFYPRAESYGNAELLVTWQDSRNGPRHYYGQRLKGDQKINANFLLTDLTEKGEKQYNSLASDADGNFVQVWVDRGTPMKHFIRARRYFAEGKPKEASFRVDSDENSSHQEYPAIAVREDGSFVTTWHDDRTRQRNIYYQQFTNKGVAVDTNQTDTTPTASYQPDIAIGQDGGFILTWYEYRPPNYEIISQRFDKNGMPIGDDFIVSRNDEGSSSYTPKIASNKRGKFVIAWRQYINNSYHILAQLYSENGDTLGPNIRVSPDSINATHTEPRVGIDSTGAFAVVWYSSGFSSGNDQDIVMQRFSSKGKPLGNYVIVNDDSTNSNQYYPDIDIHEDGDAIVVWSDYRSLRSLYYQKYSNIGSSDKFAVIDSNIAISDNTLYGQNNRVAMNDQKDFVIAFMNSNGNDNDLFIKAYNNDGTVHAELSAIAVNSEREQKNLDLEFVKDKIYSVWQDNHQMGVGYDIYANIIDWNGMVSGVEPLSSTIPEDYELKQNYPNPFNPSTTINYKLRITDYVELNIYNLLGQKVTTLVDRNQTAGSYSVKWDARDFASGIYYYQLRTDAGFLQTKKMVLVK